MRHVKSEQMSHLEPFGVSERCQGSLAPPPVQHLIKPLHLHTFLWKEGQDEDTDYIAQGAFRHTAAQTQAASEMVPYAGGGQKECTLGNRVPI